MVRVARQLSVTRWSWAARQAHTHRARALAWRHRAVSTSITNYSLLPRPGTTDLCPSWHSIRSTSSPTSPSTGVSVSRFRAIPRVIDQLGFWIYAPCCFNRKSINIESKLRRTNCPKGTTRAPSSLTKLKQSKTIMLRHKSYRQIKCHLRCEMNL